MELRNYHETVNMEEKAFSQWYDTTFQWSFVLLCFLANSFGFKVSGIFMSVFCEFALLMLHLLFLNEEVFY